MIPVLANQATASKRRMIFHLVGPDGITPATGEAGGQPQISVNGGAFASAGIGTLTHTGFGRCYADVAQATVATAGDVIDGRYKSANTAECPAREVLRVVAYDPDDVAALGLSSVAAIKAKTDQLVFTLAGKVDSAIVDAASFVQVAADKVWASATRTLTAGVDITLASVAAVWDYLRTLLVTPGSIGELLVGTLDATVSSRATQASVDALAATVGGDPLLAIVPGDYPSGTAGAAIGRIGSASVTVVSPVAEDGTTITVTRGDDYAAADARAISWADEGNQWLDPIASAVFTARIGEVVEFMKPLTIVTATGGGKQVQLELTSAETTEFELGTPAYRYDVEFTGASGNKATDVRGRMNVEGDQTHA